MIKLNKFHHKWARLDAQHDRCQYCALVRHNLGQETYYTRPGIPLKFDTAGPCPQNPLMTQTTLELK